MTAYNATAARIEQRLTGGQMTAQDADQALTDLRDAFRRLDRAEREQVKAASIELAGRVKTLKTQNAAPAAPTTTSPAAPVGASSAAQAFAGLTGAGASSSGDGALADAFAGLTGDDGEDEAQLALQGLAGLEQRAPDRFYDGPADPDALLSYFGLPSFRPGQREAVEAALAGRDSLVIMPTGGGKSLCYSLPGLATGDLTIVVSPLIALMADQYRRLAAGGHPAVMLASGLDEDVNRSALAAIEDGYARIVFCSPERFESASFLNAITSRKVGLFVVDEAHCVSAWGHDFRPSYLRLHGALKRLGDPPVMACTATATPEVAQEIIRRLRLRDPVEITSGFDRPNLSFDAIQFEGAGSVERKFQALHAAVSKPENRPAIVYCGTRKDVDQISDRLVSLGLNAVGYHAGLAPDERASAQHRFMRDDADIVVATNAFGMGVDKPNVRLVVHHQIPQSVEAYYQEAGRAGRDGLPARALLLAMRGDLGRLAGFNRNRSTSLESVVAFLKRLRRVAKDSVVKMDAPRDDDDRLALFVAERAGALMIEPAVGGQLKVTLGTKLDAGRARSICQIAKDRGWEAYRAVEKFAFSTDTCRRAQVLAHFGDTNAPVAEGRCCDVCDPIDWLPAVDDLPQVAGGSKSSKKKQAKPAVAASPADAPLLEALKDWRKQACGDKPAYTVCNNATLEQIAAVKPVDEDALLAIKGVGPSFVTKHAGAVFALVARHP